MAKFKITRSILIALFFMVLLSPAAAHTQTENIFDIQSTVKETGGGEYELKTSWQLKPEFDGKETSAFGLRQILTQYAEKIDSPLVFTVEESGKEILKEELNAAEAIFSWEEDGTEKSLQIRQSEKTGSVIVSRSGENIQNSSKYKYSITLKIKPSLRAKCFVSNAEDWEENTFSAYPFTDSAGEKGFQVIDNSSIFIYTADSPSRENVIPSPALKAPYDSVFKEVTVKKEWKGTPPEGITIKAQDQTGEIYEFTLFGEETDEHGGDWQETQVLPLYKIDEETGEDIELKYTFTEEALEGFRQEKIEYFTGEEKVDTFPCDMIVITNTSEKEAPATDPDPSDPAVDPEEPGGEDPTEPSEGTDPTQSSEESSDPTDNPANVEDNTNQPETNDPTEPTKQADMGDLTSPAGKSAVTYENTLKSTEKGQADRASERKGGENSPKTSDNMPLGIALILFALAGTTCCIGVQKQKRIG